MIWCILRKDNKKFYLLMILFFCSTILAHLPEFIFGFGFIIFFYIAKKIIERRIEKGELKKLFIAILVTLIITSYYLVLFRYGMFETQGKSQPFVITYKEMISQGHRVVAFLDMSLPIVILLITGLLVSLYYFLSKRKIHVAAVMGMYFLLLGFSNYFGVGYRAFHVRAFWPFYLSPLFGISVYFLIKLVIKEIKQIAAVIVSIILFSAIVYAFYSPIKGPGMMDQDHWDAFQWLNKNTAEKDKVFLFYGDGYSQNGRLIHRLTYFINVDDYVKSLQNNTLKRYYKAELFTLTEGNLMYWKDYFKIGYHATEDNFSFIGYEDVCSSNYYVFDKISAYAPGLAQANVYVMSVFLKNNMTEVYSNKALSIVKNNNPGGNCFEKT
jgi:hypothetical protein